MSKILNFMGKENLFFWSLPINPWASLTTWLHLEAPSKISKKINKYQLSNIELVLTHMVLELGVLGISGKFLVPSTTLCIKKVSKKIKNLLLKAFFSRLWLSNYALNQHKN